MSITGHVRELHAPRAYAPVANIGAGASRIVTRTISPGHMIRALGVDLVPSHFTLSREKNTLSEFVKYLEAYVATETREHDRSHWSIVSHVLLLHR
jgi:hypothetical protein